MRPLPNIIYILADDMGYGDLAANNPQSKIPTPHLDRLAQQGMRFTDAHAVSAVCTPSRYGILTGRYCWRSRLKSGIVWQWDGSLIEPDRLTVAGFLRQQGYHTACIGKWHLGWDWPTLDGSHPNDHLSFGQHDTAARLAYESQIDYRQAIRGGPVDRGFDHYFGVDVPNFPPYAWFENDRLTEVPTLPKAADLYGADGLMVEGWRHQRMLPRFAEQAVQLIERQASRSQPFFLYLPLTSPHSPVVPNPQFIGKSGAGNYGDFICETDWLVGQVLDALDRTGTADNTLIIFTSDNGPELGMADDIGVYARIRQHQHYSMGDLRGIKRDAWEGGHRVPMVARWPKVIPANVVCPQMISLADLMSTCADIVEQSLPDQAGEDSVSMLPLLKGDVQRPTRDMLASQGYDDALVVRYRQWVYINAATGDQNLWAGGEPDWFKQERGYTPHPHPAELYDLSLDPAQRMNQYADRPDVLAKMRELMQQIAAPQGLRQSASTASDIA